MYHNTSYNEVELGYGINRMVIILDAYLNVVYADLCDLTVTPIIRFVWFRLISVIQLILLHPLWYHTNKSNSYAVCAIFSINNTFSQILVQAFHWIFRVFWPLSRRSGL